MKGYLLNGRLEAGLPVTMMAGREGIDKAVVVIGEFPEGCRRYVALDYKNPPTVLDGQVFEAAPFEVTVEREGNRRVFTVLKAPDPDESDFRALVLIQTRFWEDTEADDESKGGFTRLCVAPGSGTLLIMEDATTIATEGGSATNYCGTVTFRPKRELKRPHTTVRRL